MFTLNSVYPKGNTKIYYQKNFTHLPLVKKDTFNETHILVGEIEETDLEAIFEMMQGEMWSPNGEARDLIRSLGIQHTSMSVGDAVQIEDKIFVVDILGFTELIDEVQTSYEA